MEVRLHMPIALRLSVQYLLGVDIGVVIDVNEGLECDPEELAVIEQRTVMIRECATAQC
jgi:hypothetical protein